MEKLFYYSAMWDLGDKYDGISGHLYSISKAHAYNMVLQMFPDADFITFEN